MFVPNPIQKALHQYFPVQLAALRQDQQMTHEQLAEKTAIELRQVKRFEAGDAQPSLDELHKIAAALAVGMDALLAPPKV
jgi:transcriptional regulator with XRE-family HTH domain